MRSQTADHEHTIADTKIHGRARRRVPVNDRAEQGDEQQTRKRTQRAETRIRGQAQADVAAVRMTRAAGQVHANSRRRCR